MADKNLALRLDFRSGLPIYTQIVNQVQQQVSGGVLKPGDQLPTVRALATELRVNFNTVARAYRLLDEAGVISTQQGRGTYIMEKPPPGVEKRLRRQTLEALARQYIGEAKRVNFSDAEINQMLRDQLKSWKETEEVDSE
ncbi:MAG TPA: GntR family transcriptional regulator [Anaerolineales bacterium]|jgi:GntR family transcriptional regulator|nr:GntR family transcriptional regulator [Anaerolineales bacterium]